MRITKVSCCANCPYNNQDREIANCTHTRGRTGYENALPRSHFSTEPVPKWCPIVQGSRIVKRDSDDKIIGITNIIFIGKVSK